MQEARRDEMEKNRDAAIGFALVGVIAFAVMFMTNPVAISAQSTEIPSWIKNTAKFWANGSISDSEFGEAVSFLIEQKIIRVEMPVKDNPELQNKINQLELENKILQNEVSSLKNENSQLQAKTYTSQPYQTAKSASTGISDNKLYDLLPSKSDLDSKWKVVKSGEFSKPTKTFYYENAGETIYNKDVNTIKKYRMDIFLFSSESAAKEIFEKRSHSLKDLIGSWYEGKYKSHWPEQIIMDSKIVLPSLKIQTTRASLSTSTDIVLLESTSYIRTLQDTILTCTAILLI